MGRVAALNGSSRAVLPPLAVGTNGHGSANGHGANGRGPGAGAMRRYRQPPPPRRSAARLVGKVFGWILLALLVVAAGIGGGLYLYGHETLSGLAAHTKGAIASSKDKNLHPIASPSQPATALIVGYDTRKGVDASLGQQSRSDTIMLVRADPTNNTLSLLSFPRDLIVPIYCHGNDVPVDHNRINSAWSTCGEQGTLDTVAHLTGVQVNYLITLDFHGFKLLVNKLHGVYIDVDHRYYIPPNTGVAAIDLEPGYQKLDGQQALNFVRFRHTDSDLYRNARQQIFLEALKDRLASSLSITEIPQIIGAVRKSVEVVKPGAGAPSISEIQSYAGLGYRLPPGHLFRNSIPNLVDCGFQLAEVCTQQSDVDSAVQSFEHPDVTLPTRANDAALGRKYHVKKQKTLKPSQITTLILNGTTELGLARDTSYKFAVAGYHTVQLPTSMKANAPSQTNFSSTVYYDAVQPNAKQAARQIQQALGPHTLVAPLNPEFAPYAQEARNPLTVVVVGTAFDGKLVTPEAHVQAAPPHEPPAVRSDPGLTLTSLEELRGKVPFRIMVPHVIHSASTLTSNEPFRAFKPAPHRHELAITFVTGAGNVYWQVIETDWDDAPILRKPTDKTTIGGRRFELYTNGGNVHMVVLRQGGATYWVVNTLRDELSNETMLAIAKGLQPLAK